MFHRNCPISTDDSFFLFGPRGTGKSTLVQTLFKKNKTHVFDLLDYDLENRLSQRPQELRELILSLSDSVEWIVIDEVQKVPELLNEVHHQIESNPKRHFVLTGSSARKLKKSGVNLLAGRAFTYYLHPLTYSELGDHFKLDDVLHYGSLPKVILLNSTAQKKRFLRSYAQTYMQAEIQAEGLVRNLPAFRRFLPLAATANGQILSYTGFAQDVGVDHKTIASYFEILEDTLLGWIIPAYRRSIRKRQLTHPKFYFFDLGVKRVLAKELNIPLLPGQTDYGRAFEHFILLELKRLNDYHEMDFTFSYFATHDLEIDLIIERPGRSPLVVEIKSMNKIKNSLLRSLSMVAKDIKHSRAICISQEPRKRQFENVTIYPWQEALKDISDNKIPS